MKRQSILLILLLLLTLTTLCGCSGAEINTKELSDAAPMKIALEETTEDAVVETVLLENVTGVFEGLEDNHTALFSFNGVEQVFVFEDSTVQSILSEAVIGSSYTLSYSYDSSLGLNILYEISE